MTNNRLLKVAIKANYLHITYFDEKKKNEGLHKIKGTNLNFYFMLVMRRASNQEVFPDEQPLEHPTIPSQSADNTVAGLSSCV